MKCGDLVRYSEVCDFFQNLGIIVGGPNYIPGRATSWKVWWMNQRNDDGSAKMGWWDDHQLEVLSEAG